MASVFKRGGRENRRGCWYVAWVTADGKRKIKSTKTTDKAAADRIAAKLGADVALRRDGVIDAGMDRTIEQERRPLAEHLTEFHASLQARGNSPQHCRETKSMAAAVIAKCKAERIADLTASAVEQSLRDLRRGGASTRSKSAGLSARTANAYLRAIKSFTRWLQRDRRARQDALETLAAINEETDRRHVRRDLSPEELAWLIKATESFTLPEHFAPGPDRAMLYRLAYGTGFRAGELRSLTPESFVLDDHPTVTVAAAYSKNRKTSELPLPSDLAEQLRTWLPSREPRAPIFGRVPKHTARILRADLKHARAVWIEAAGGNAAERQRREQSDFLRYLDAAGEVADFHAFRHAFISAVVASGASVKVAQELARHSTPALTIGRYSHARLHDLRGAVEAIVIPPVPAAESSGHIAAAS